MSDVSRGPGWWMASDGKWYPPESVPPPPPPPSAEATTAAALAVATPLPGGPPPRKPKKPLAKRPFFWIALAVVLIIIVTVAAGVATEKNNSGSAASANMGTTGTNTGASGSGSTGNTGSTEAAMSAWAQSVAPNWANMQVDWGDIRSDIQKGWGPNGNDGCANLSQQADSAEQPPGPSSLPAVSTWSQILSENGTVVADCMATAKTNDPETDTNSDPAVATATINEINQVIALASTFDSEMNQYGGVCLSGASIGYPNPCQR